MNGFFPEGWNTQVTDSKKAFTPAFLAEAQAKQTVLESTALMCDAAHNLIIDLGQIKGIIPREEGAIGIADRLNARYSAYFPCGKARMLCGNRDRQ